MPTPRSIAAAAGAAVLVAGALATSAPRQAWAQNGNPRSATVQKVFPSAVRIQLSSAGQVVRSASGIAFAREGDRTYVLTNAHVVEQAPAWKEPIQLRVLTSSPKQTLPGRVVARGRVPDSDLAVVEVNTALPVVALAGDDALDLGDDLVVIGAPFGKGLSVAAGIVSQVEYDPTDGEIGAGRPRSLKTDAAIGYGSSGGGVFDVPGGRLVGLVEGYRTARVVLGKGGDSAVDLPMPGETFVAPAAKIRRFLADQGLGKLAQAGPGAGARGGATIVPASTSRM